MNNRPICSADGCSRREPCGFNCRDNGNFDKPVQAEFDDCENSPSGKHSESWFANGDCEHCKTGAQPNAPMYYAKSVQVEAPKGFHVCPRHDFHIVSDPKAGCEFCNADSATPPAPATVQVEAPRGWATGLGLAVIGRNHFGNPIPQEWYAAARELLEKVATPPAPCGAVEREALSCATCSGCATWKWGYEYLQSRMESIGRHGWAHDCDGEIEARIAAARASGKGSEEQ